MLAIPLLFSIVFFCYAFGTQPLHVHDLNWLFQGDTATHFLGWALYEQSPWGFPLGRIAHFMPDIGVSVITTDSIPLLAVLMKLLFGWADQPFQYSGLWLLACYLLQAFFGYRLLALLTKNKPFAAVGACFFVLSPVLLYRADHKALCAHWLVLWSLYLYFQSAEFRRPPLWSAFFVNLIAAGTHPYLLPMVFLLTLALYANLFFQSGRKNLKLVVSHLAIVLAGIVGELYLLGAFLIQSPGAGGFALFSTDLLAFFNSMGHSAFIKAIRYSSSQGEGFAYLGLGLIALLIFNGVLRWRSKKKIWPKGISVTPLIAALVLMYFFALSSHVSFGGNTILFLDGFYNHFEPIPSIFRASGRFVWPMYYFFVTFILLGAFCLLQKRFLFAVIFGVLLLQFFDLHPFYENRNPRVPPTTAAVSLLQSPFWETLKSTGLKEMLFVPPILPGFYKYCSQQKFSPNEYWAFALQALKNKMIVHSGYSARLNISEQFCEEFWKNITKEEHEGDLFVISKTRYYWPEFQKYNSRRKKPLRCSLVDGFHVCRL